ncbi:MAG TPA: hypothetical protein VF167_03360 [Longimicrobiaceae bacterium]
MRFRARAACAALALGALLPAAASAQSPDAYVLPFGMFRLGVEGVHASWSSRFDADGNRVDLGSDLGGDLTPDRFTALAPLQAQLTAFLDATQGSSGASPEPPSPSSITLGLLDVAASASHTAARGRLAVGILPRLELGASMSIGRGDRLVHRFELQGGNLGLNPDAEGNAALLAAIGWEELGALPLLPTSESPLGMELQNRVTELAGEPMALPEDTANTEVLAALLSEQFGFDPLASRIERWRAGDLEMDAKALLLSTFGGAPVPADPGFDLRIALLGGARFATGEQPDTMDLLTPEPSEGLSSWSGGAAVDLFLGSHIWVSGSLRFTRGRESEIVRRIPGENPLDPPQEPTAVSIKPGDITELRVAPRYRLDRAISVGAEYALYEVGDTRYTGGTEERPADVLNLAGGRLQRFGLEIRYSSLPAYWVREAILPAEVTLAYQRTLGGPEGTPGGGRLTVTASLLPRLW